jgi:transposase
MHEPIGRPKLDAWERSLLFYLAKAYPQSSLAEFSKSIAFLTGKHMKKGGTCSIFTQWGFSYKKVETKHKLKYTTHNIERYIRHVTSMPQIVMQYGLNRIKYVDEVHFVLKNLFKQRAISPRGKTICIQKNTNLSETYSMTLLTALDQDVPFVVPLRTGSNTQFDFELFLADCIATGYLTQGDILIMDNASVHVGNETFATVHDTISQLNINLCFLPAYSPELNPVEYVFSYIKGRLRNERDCTKPFIDDLLNVMTGLHGGLLLKYYKKSIFDPKIR